MDKTPSVVRMENETQGTDLGLWDDTKLCGEAHGTMALILVLGNELDRFTVPVSDEWQDPEALKKCIVLFDMAFSVLEERAQTWLDHE